MESLSPGRTVKVTYLGRTKRKRAPSEYHENPSDSDSEPNDVKLATPFQSPSISQRSVSPTKRPPHNKAPQKVDVHLPGPSPKRARRDSDDARHDLGAVGPSGKAGKSLHCRSSSSISSLSQVARQHATASPSNSASKKPISLVGTKTQSAKRAVTPETDVDDNASVAESCKSEIRTRRSEGERLQYFKDDPLCGTIEPHRVMCRRCGKFVNLGRKQSYTVRPWETHRRRCDQTVLQLTPHKSDGTRNEEMQASDDDAASTVAPSVAQSETPVRRTESERKAFLDSDPRAELVKPDEVMCRKCQKWIRLSTKQKFALTNWNKHQRSCSEAAPSFGNATDWRKLRLVNDSQVKSLSAHSVECTFCGVSIVLAGEDYNLTSWDEHKSRCTAPSTDNVATLSSKSVQSTNPSPETTKFPSMTVRPPPSSTSTDGTLIASDSSPSISASRRTKRVRDEIDDKFVDDSDLRPTNRPRKATYRPPQPELTSPMGWFLLPFKAFIRGFQESLKGDS